jgi:hypothetical protein
MDYDELMITSGDFAFWMILLKTPIAIISNDNTLKVKESSRSSTAYDLHAKTSTHMQIMW